MNHLQAKMRDVDRSEVSELVCYKCPSCNLITWRKRQLKSEVLCPFCCNRLPEYVTKIVLEKMIIQDEKSENSGKSSSNPAKSEETKRNAQESESPFITEFFMVQGIGYRCMAYRNRDGIWRGAFDNEELPGAVQVLE